MLIGSLERQSLSISTPIHLHHGQSASLPNDIRLEESFLESRRGSSCPREVNFGVSAEDRRNQCNGKSVFTMAPSQEERSAPPVNPRVFPGARA